MCHPIALTDTYQGPVSWPPRAQAGIPPDVRTLLALAALALACENPAPDPAPPAPQLKPSGDDAVRSAREHIRERLLRKLQAPEKLRETPCPSFGELGARERTLSLRVIDARYDTRSVLPLRVTRHLIEPDLNALDAVLGGIEPGDVEGALAQVARLEERRYVGAYHVIHYASPRWFVRTTTMRPAWNAGRFDAWFVIHDAKTGEAKCAARVTVNGDATNAPLRTRLRSDTRDRLTTELGERTRSATEDALGRITGELRLPSRAASTLARR